MAVDRMQNREFKRYCALLKAHALLCNRDTVDSTDVDAVDKLLTHARQMLAANIAGFTKRETAVRNAIIELKNPSTVFEIQKHLNNMIPDYAIRRALRGSKGTFDNPTTGLLKKDKNLSCKKDYVKNETVFWIEGNPPQLPATPARPDQQDEPDTTENTDTTTQNEREAKRQAHSDAFNELVANFGSKEKLKSTKP
jgi:hypothetical protein